MACKPRLLVPDADTDPSDELIESGTLMTLLKDVMMCGICYGVAKNPVRVKSCLHQYCTHCIEDYTRKFKKNCPGCRHEIGSRRLLKSDFRLNAIGMQFDYAYDIANLLIKDIDEFNKLDQE